VGFADMQRMMRQMQKMQADIQRVQEEAAARTAQGTAGGGVVVATCNGKGELVSLHLDRSVVDPDDIDMLSDLVVTAVNQALHNAQEMVAKEMEKVTAGLRLPGMPKLP